MWCAVLALAGCKKKEEAKKEPAPAAKADKEQTKTADAETKAAGGDALVKRGEYIANIMGCQQCHTAFTKTGPDTANAWAGGLEIKEKFGTWRSPNITQHADHGIGKWTDAQIIAAVREGVRPDGTRLYPIMPYPFYRVLSDDDAKALVAYMRTLPANDRKVAPTGELKLPKPELPKPAGKAPAADPVARGGYLASLMHCAMCHSPADEQGAPDFMKRPFAGGYPFEIPELGTGVLYSSNLTPHDTGIGKVSDDQLIAAVREMKRITKEGLIQGPMALYQMGWYSIKDDDAAALAAFLRSLPPAENKVPASTFVPNAPGAPPKK